MAAQNEMGGGDYSSGPTPDLGVERRVLMTLRVSRDSGRTWERGTSVKEGDPVVILSNPVLYPPCGCARHSGHGSLSAGALRPVTVEQKTE
ncbi:hypothetical protein ACGFRB_14965 [Streptomyces sp. NPDC048718]|uniref:hypothetical protein n=1 Tax=Streptomyces sp. NPDC048718 TaxID=3365587 RepID=UPI003713A293